MVDIFASEGIKYEKVEAQENAPADVVTPISGSQEIRADIFKDNDITPPTVSETNISAFNGAVDLQNPEDDRKEVAETVNDDMAQIEAIAKTRFTPEQIEEFKSNPRTFWDGFHVSIPAYSSIKTGAETLGIYNLGKKVEAGEQLSDAEQSKLNDFLDSHIEEQLRGSTWQNKVAYGLSELPAFMVEMYLSGGIGKGAQIATLKGTEKAAQKLAVDAVSKTLGNKIVKGTVGGVANAAARSATVFSPRVFQGYAERRLNDSMSITDKGELVLKKSEESPASSALMAYSYMMAEVGSELSGAALGKYLVDPAKAVLKTPLAYGINKLPSALRLSMYEAYKKIQPSAQVSKVFTAAGWNGMIEELGEERVNSVMQGFISLAGNDQQMAQDGKNFTASDFFNAITPTGEQLLVEAGIISIAGGVKSSAGITFNLLKSKGFSPDRANEMVDTMTAQEQDDFISEQMKPPSTPNQTFAIPKETQLSEVERVANSPLVDLARNSETPEAFIEAAMNTDGVDWSHQKYFLTTTAAENFIASVKGGYYNVPQNADTALYADGIMSEQTYDAQTAANQDSNIVLFDAATNRINETDPPPINHEQSLSDKMITEFRNEQWSIHKLGEMAREVGADVEGFVTKKFSPVELATRMYSSVMTQAQWAINQGTFYYDKVTGNAVNTGKALKKTLDDFDNFFMEQEPSAANRRVDLKDYLIAQRYLQDLMSKEDVVVTEQQRTKSATDIVRLQEKYGDNYQFFNTFAQEIYDFQKNVLYRLVVSGNMSEDKFNSIVKANPNYIPFQRVIDKENLNTVIRSNPLFDNAKSSKVIKELHGSELEVKDPLQSIILNTHKITDLALKNDAALQIANYAEVLPEYVQKVPALMVNKGKAKVKVTYDKKLRTKLEQAIEFFNNTFEQKKTLNQRGQRGYVRGDYSPSERLVRLRLGSSDAVLTHEVGHMLDFSLGLGKNMLKNEKIKKELQNLAEERMASDTELNMESGKAIFEDTLRESESEKHKEYLKNDYEIIANFFDAYVNAPDLLKKHAPTAQKAFDDMIDARPEIAFIKDIKPSLERAEETIEQDVWGESQYAPQGTITVFREGKKEYYALSKPILEAVKHLSPQQLNIFDRLIVRPAMNLFRMGATLTPEFMLRSIPREGLTALITNRDVKFNASNYARGFLAVVQNAVGSQNDLYKDYSRSARFNGYQEITEQTATDMFSTMISGKGRVMQYATNPRKFLVETLKMPLRGLEAVGSAVDQVARVGAYDAAKRAGFSDYEAALVSRDVFDYSRGGSFVNKANQYIPFFRAAVNGSDKLYRAFKDRPVETALWGIMTVTLPSVALTSYYLYYAPDEDRQQYLEIPESLRAVFWFYKEDGEWKRMPKPFQMGQFFGTIPEMTMIWMYEENKPEGFQMAKTIVGGIVESAAPVTDWSSLIPLVMKVPAEWAANYNFFWGKDIYPKFLDGKDPAYRVNPWNSETAKVLGKAFDVSPAKIDNALKGVLAGSADYVTKAGDFAINSVREFNGETVPEKPVTPSDVMILRAISQRRPAGFRSNSYQTFSDNYRNAQQRGATVRDLEGKEKAEYLQKHGKEISIGKSLSSTKKEIGIISKQLDAIYDHKSMSSEEKVQRINTLEDRITDLARKANKQYNKAMR